MTAGGSLLAGPSGVWSGLGVPVFGRLCKGGVRDAIAGPVPRGARCASRRADGRLAQTAQSRPIPGSSSEACSGTTQFACASVVADNSVVKRAINIETAGVRTHQEREHH